MREKRHVIAESVLGRTLVGTVVLAGVLLAASNWASSSSIPPW